MPDLLREYTTKAMHHLGADILGLDFLQDQDGRYYLLESNDIPGLSAFPDEVRTSLARILREKMEL